PSSDALGTKEVPAAETQPAALTNMAEGSPQTGTRPVRALAAALHDLVTGRHEPREGRPSCGDLWGPAGEIPAGYPARWFPIPSQGPARSSSRSTPRASASWT